MHAQLVEQRCPTCGSSDLLERFHALVLPVPTDGDRDEPGYLCLDCEIEFLLEPIR